MPNSFPDIPRPAAEVKLYNVDAIDSGKIDLGVEDPLSEEPVSKGVHGVDDHETADYPRPAPTRYVIGAYEETARGIEDIDPEDLDDIVASQPAIEADDILDDSIDVGDRTISETIEDADVSVEEALRGDISDEDFKEMRGVVIASGKALGSDEVDVTASLSEVPQYEVEPQADPSPAEDHVQPSTDGNDEQPPTDEDDDQSSLDSFV